MIGLPDEGQLLLLDAALGQGESAAQSWAEWERRYKLDRPDEGSYRLLPLVYRNLATQGFSGPEWNRLKGIHRRAWSENQVLFHRVRPLVEELAARDIPVMLLKGAALASLVYPDAGCRPMRDVDLLVPAKFAPEAFRLVEERGARSLYFRPRDISDGFLRFRHAMDFELGGGGFVDLHWHVLHLCCHESADALFWEETEAFPFGGLEVETCGATGQLLQICTHGIVGSPVPPVRWIADAVLLLRSGRVVDWKKLAAAAERWDIVPYVRQALAILRERFAAEIPAWVVEDLGRAPVSGAAQAEFARECAPADPRTAWQDLLSFYARWRRSLGGASPAANAAGFARHLQYAFELSSPWKLPAQFAKSAIRRAGAAGNPHPPSL
jgi:hypothetical protein